MVESGASALYMSSEGESNASVMTYSFMDQIIVHRKASMMLAGIVA